MTSSTRAGLNHLAGFRGRVAEAVLLQRPHAVGQHRIGHLDALGAVDLAQLFDQPLAPSLAVELAIDQLLTVPQGIHDIHRHHEVFQRRRLGCLHHATAPRTARSG
jgi:hypothetical protein